MGVESFRCRELPLPAVASCGVILISSSIEAGIQHGVYFISFSSKSRLSARSVLLRYLRATSRKRDGSTDQSSFGQDRDGQGRHQGKIFFQLASSRTAPHSIKSRDHADISGASPGRTSRRRAASGSATSTSPAHRSLLCIMPTSRMDSGSDSDGFAADDRGEGTSGSAPSRRDLSRSSSVSMQKPSRACRSLILPIVSYAGRLMALIVPGDICRRRKQRCSGPDSLGRCSNCLAGQLQCTYNAPARKRTPPPPRG